MRKSTVRIDLATASSCYRDALAEFQKHRDSLPRTLAGILPEKLKPQFQSYLDFKHNPQIHKELGLPITPPEGLMDWGLSVERKLQETHNRSDQLRERLFTTLSEALYALGYTVPEWAAPRADLAIETRLLEQKLLPLACEYRREHLDGKSVLTTDGPFISGLARRLGVKTDAIYGQDAKVSAFEMAYWAITDNTDPQGLAQPC